MESQHECTICGIQFATKGTLTRHKTTKRHLLLTEAKDKGQAETYEELKVLARSCQVCDKVFCDKESLKKHEKTKRHLAKLAALGDNAQQPTPVPATDEKKEEPADEVSDEDASSA